MIFKRIIMIGLGLFLITVLPLQAGPAKGKPVKPLKQWSGSVEDLALQKAAPEVIDSAPELEKLWQAWKVPGPAPQVNFAQELVVVTTTRGSRLRFGATLDERGDLQVAGLATRDLRPGFRYVIAVVTREGVKTVNGKELAAAGAKSSANPTQDRDIKDFGVTDVEVRSVKSLDVEKFNQEIAAAKQSGQAWPQQAVLVALKCSSEDLKGHTKAIDVRTPPEQGQEAVVTVTESGYLDDAMGGERWRLWLTQDSEGTWTVKRALYAQLCQRPTHTYYSADACP
jgi:hypothetical protein